MRGHRHRRGVTLIEAVMAIVVLGLALPPLMTLFIEVASHAPDDRYERVGLAYANGLMEEIASKHFEDPDEANGSFGTEEGSRSAYDDVDDYDGMIHSPPEHLDGSTLGEYGGFTRSVVVHNMTREELEPDLSEEVILDLDRPTEQIIVQPIDGSTPFKRVRVTVSWTGGKGGELSLTTLRTDLDGNADAGPIDVPGSEPTAFNPSEHTLEFAIINATDRELEIASFSLSADRPVPDLWEFELANRSEDWGSAWEGRAALPTATLFTEPDSSPLRTVPVGGIAGALFRFHEPIVPGPVEFSLVLNFTDGSTTTLEFSFEWGS